MDVLAIDLSLTATGVVYPDGSVSTVVWDKGKNHLARMRAARQFIYARAVKIGVCVMEGYSFNSKDGSAFDRAEVRGTIRMACADNDIPFVEIPPTVIKVFATGKGNSGKAAVLAEAIRRLDYQGSSDNEADALWLWHLTRMHLGMHSDIPQLPQTHLRALDTVKTLDWQGVSL